MTNETDWPRRLRALRKTMGLTQAQMAQAIGLVQASHVAQMESGKKTITPMLERLIAAYEAGYRPDGKPITEAEHMRMARGG